jgi:hypothetical protein
MDWKEQLDKEVGWLVDDKKGGWTTGKQPLLDFISTQIIEKLIADIPNNAWARNGRQTLKQQLRNKWQ